MEDILIFSIPPALLWIIILIIYMSKKKLEKNATEMTIGTVVKNSIGKRVSNESTHYYRKLLIEYQIDGKIYKTEIQVNQLIYFRKIPIGQKTGLPVGTRVELLYNPKNISQIYSKIDDQFNKK
ncbi:hypothetical protein A5819_000057, partial [Enterococcus sp. 7E2_DIV0204]|uniref:DUF3592 domain-containing protein n=2 Tax=Enterococcus TaxID=1350 RepID=UPI000B6A6ED4